METAAEGFAIAFLIGALIGIEREKTQRASGVEHGIAGLRTFILLALSGALAAWLSVETRQPWIFAAIGFGCILFVLAGYVTLVRAVPGAHGLTTEVAALFTYLLGGTVLFGQPQLAVALAIATSAVLAFREVLHGAVERIGWDDIFAALKLLVVVFIVLPVAPRYAVDPWGVLNPYSLTWLVILIAGLSFLGYVATRWVGPTHGAALTGLLGGLVSSTAVTLGLSRRSRDSGEAAAAGALAAGILFSWAVMAVRVVVEAAVVNRDLVRPLLAPMGTMAAVAAIGALVHMRRDHPTRKTVPALPLKNPFSLRFALKFALVLAVITVLVDRAHALFPGAGVFVVSALAGIADVDAITLSMAEQAKHGTTAQTAVAAIALAVLVNTLVKCGFVLWIAGGALRRRVAPVAVAIVLGAVAAYLIAL